MEARHRSGQRKSTSKAKTLGKRKNLDSAATWKLGISKCGNNHLRWLLVQAAHYILSRLAPDSRLRRWGMQLASRGGKNGKRRAVVAVARKLAVLLHRLWVTGEVYEPLYGLAADAV